MSNALSARSYPPLYRTDRFAPPLLDYSMSFQLRSARRVVGSLTPAVFACSVLDLKRNGATGGRPVQ